MDERFQQTHEHVPGFKFLGCNCTVIGSVAAYYGCSPMEVEEWLQKDVEQYFTVANNIENERKKQYKKEAEKNKNPY